jgi:hypothetical protein
MSWRKSHLHAPDTHGADAHESAVYAGGQEPGDAEACPIFPFTARRTRSRLWKTLDATAKAGGSGVLPRRTGAGMAMSHNAKMQEQSRQLIENKGKAGETRSLPLTDLGRISTRRDRSAIHQNKKCRNKAVNLLKTKDS